jgi:hypothetical protein
MPIWLIGLATRESAKRAAIWGAIACFIQAARIGLGMVVQLSTSNKSIDSAVAWAVGASVVPALIVVAGLSLKRGEGRSSGSLAVLLLAADLAFYTPITLPMTISTFGPLGIKVMLLLVIANGVRGAFALAHVDNDSGVREIFK